MTQEALARRITGRGVKISQEMLSRYLHRVRPTLARPDVIRAMHEILGRSPQELTAALGLHQEASARPDCASAPAPVLPETGAATRAEAAVPAAGPLPARTRWQWIMAAVLTAFLASGLTAVWTKENGYSSARSPQPWPPATSSDSPSPSSSPSSAPSAAGCRANPGTDSTILRLRLDPIPEGLSGRR
ncbi:hypothetical protein [Streptomyces sp. NPDC002588]|uniref:hypothetical protein n=1 Tax=Streptomyces sp. NPDC002588 TaxID=3154419 RepID=UPI003320E263